MGAYKGIWPQNGVQNRGLGPLFGASLGGPKWPKSTPCPFGLLRTGSKGGPNRGSPGPGPWAQGPRIRASYGIPHQLMGFPINSWDHPSTPRMVMHRDDGASDAASMLHRCSIGCIIGAADEGCRDEAVPVVHGKCIWGITTVCPINSCMCCSVP